MADPSGADVRKAIMLRRHQERQAARLRQRELTDSDRRAASARASYGTVTQPEDHGAGGPASLARDRVLESADGQHVASHSRKGSVQKRIRIQCECHVEWLAVRGHITPEQKAVAMRFRAMWLASRHSSRVAANYGERFGRSSGGMTESEYRIDARSWVDRALAACTPPQQRALTAIAGEDRPAGLVLKTFCAALDAIEDMLRRERRGR